MGAFAESIDSDLILPRFRDQAKHGEMLSCVWIFSFVVSMIVVLFILSISAVRVPKKHSLIVHQ